MKNRPKQQFCENCKYWKCTKGYVGECHQGKEGEPIPETSLYFCCADHKFRKEN